MKNIVIVARAEHTIWVFGVYSTFKSAYENLTTYYSEALEYSEFPNNVRGFTKAVRENEIFSFTRYSQNGVVHSTSYDFMVFEVDHNETLVQTYSGIEGFESV